MAACMEMFLAASRSSALEDVVVREPIQIERGGTVQVIVDGERVELYQREGEEWKLRAGARPAKSGPRPDPVSRAGLQSSMPASVDPLRQYELLRSRSIELGAPFQLLGELWAGDRQALGRLRVPSEKGEYRFHPALIDACIQVLSAAVGSENGLYLPVGIDRFELFGLPSAGLWSHASLRPAAGDTLTGDIRILGEHGRICARFEGLRLRRASARRAENCLYEVAWREKSPAGLPVVRFRAFG